VEQTQRLSAFKPPKNKPTQNTNAEISINAMLVFDWTAILRKEKCIEEYARERYLEWHDLSGRITACQSLRLRQARVHTNGVGVSAQIHKVFVTGVARRLDVD
jgi:hypothetical protein